MAKFYKIHSCGTKNVSGNSGPSYTMRFSAPYGNIFPYFFDGWRYDKVVSIKNSWKSISPYHHSVTMTLAGVTDANVSLGSSSSTNTISFTLNPILGSDSMTYDSTFSVSSYPAVQVNGAYKVRKLASSLTDIGGFIPLSFRYGEKLYYGLKFNSSNDFAAVTEQPSSNENIKTETISFNIDDKIMFDEGYIPQAWFDSLLLLQAYEYTYSVFATAGSLLASEKDVPAVKHLKFSVSETKMASLIVTGVNDENYTLTWTITSPPEGMKFLGLSFVKTSRRPSIPIGYDQDITIDGNLELYEVFGRDYTPTKTFEMNIYKNSAESNRVDKTNQLVFVDTLNGVLRESSSIVEPVFNISESDVPQFNYVYIPAFNRYYFVVELTSMNYNLWRLSLKCDVLMTYKDGIKALNAFVERNEIQFDENIVDKLRPIEEGYDVQSTEIPNNLFGNLSIADKYIVVTGAGITIEEEE